MILSFTFSLDITLLSDFFFSKLGKYLLFFSPCSTICAFDLIISPFNLFSLKADRNPNDKYVFKKELYKPCILIPVLSKLVEKWGSCGRLICQVPFSSDRCHALADLLCQCQLRQLSLFPVFVIHL